VRRNNGTVSRVEVERGTYQIPSVSARRDQDALVIRILFFGSGAASQVQAALQDWSGPAIVLDLRDNPGGSLDEMVAVADLFLDPEAVIVQTAHGGETGYTMHGTEPALWTGGVMILVNRGTSEVAEALAAALQDHGRARVVGTRSAGQGIRSSFYPAGRGLMLKIADTRMTSPSGRSWHSQGLTPDIFVQSQQLTLPALGRSAPPDIQRDAAVRLISTQESDH
jgi:carboxyl-terminal processing protease